MQVRRRFRNQREEGQARPRGYLAVDARRLHTRQIALDAPGFWTLTVRYWYQYTSFFAIIVSK